MAILNIVFFGLIMAILNIVFFFVEKLAIYHLTNFSVNGNFEQFFGRKIANLLM